MSQTWCYRMVSPMLYQSTILLHIVLEMMDTTLKMCSDEGLRNDLVAKGTIPTVSIICTNSVLSLNYSNNNTFAGNRTAEILPEPQIIHVDNTVV